jgi:hypothetical protein
MLSTWTFSLPSVVLFRRTVKLKPICRDAQSDAVAGHRVAGAYRAVLRTKFPVSPNLSRHSAAEAVYVVASFFSTHPCQAQLLGYQLVDHPLRQKSNKNRFFFRVFSVVGIQIYYGGAMCLARYQECGLARYAFSTGFGKQSRQA